MSNFVLVFRTLPDRKPAEAVEAEWSAWFGEIGGQVADFGHRIGQASIVGGDSPDALGGYVVITADDLAAAVAVAEGCPGLRQGGRVEVGEVIAT